MKSTPRTKRVLLIVSAALFSLILLVWALGGLAWWPQHFAQQALARRDYTAAAAWARQAAQLDRHNAETELLLGRIERKLGHREESHRHLRLAATLGGDRQRIRREELLAQAQTGELDGILADLDRLLIEHSGDGAEICEAYANGLLVNGQVDEALAIIGQWQQAFPADPQPDNLRGRIAEFQIRTNEAERHYRAALAKQPRHFPALFGLGRTLLELNRWSEALDAYQTCLRSPFAAPAQLGMARCLTNLGRDEEALQRLREAATQEPEPFREALRQLGEPTEYNILDFELGALEAKLGHTDAAIAALDRAVKFNSKHRQARYQLALALNTTGRSAEAEAHFEWHVRIEKKLADRDRLHDVVQQHPRDLDARSRLGAVYLETDSDEAGLFWLRGVLAEDPRHRATHDALATFYEAQATTNPAARPLAQHHRDLANARP